MKIRFFFRWFDLWVGAYWDRKAGVLYVCPVPMCGVALTFWAPSVEGIGLAIDKPHSRQRAKFCPDCQRPIFSRGAEGNGDGAIYDVYICKHCGTRTHRHASYCRCGCYGQGLDVFKLEDFEE